MNYWRKFGVLLAASPLFMVPAASAQDASLAERFGSLGTVLDISISPSGQKLAFVTPGGPLEDLVYLIELGPDGVQRPIALDSNPNGFITHCEWANEEYLICNFRGTSDISRAFIGYNRLLVVSADGSGVRYLESSDDHRSMGYNQYGGSILSLDVEGKPNSVLVQRAVAERFNTGTRVGSDESGLVVEEIDLDSLRGDLVIRPEENAVGYLTDETGTVRIMGLIALDGRGRMRDDNIRFAYRPAGSSTFEALEPDRDLEDFTVVGVNSAENIVYARGEENGFDSLYSVELNWQGRTTRLLEGNGYDIDGVLRLGRSGRVIGATYATDRRQFEYFDEEFKGLSRRLSDALPGNPLVEFVDASEDENWLIVLAHSDVDPGIYYLLDRSTNQMSQILPSRRELEGLQLSPVKAVSFPARDGTEIPGYLTLPPGVEEGAPGLPAIVMPHGGPGARDEWGFNWLVQFYTQNGYAVLQPNFRGSTGYGSAWQMENGFQSWQTAISDVNDAGHWLIAQGIADPQKLSVLGWSYGGYAALQSATTEPDLYKAVVAIAPVTDLGKLRDDARNFSNYPIVSEFLGRGSHIQTGSPARNAERIKAPVLLVHGEYDENVPYEHSELMVDALEDEDSSVELLTFEDIGHGLRDSGARTRMLAESEAFLRRSLNLSSGE